MAGATVPVGPRQPIGEVGRGLDPTGVARHVTGHICLEAGDEDGDVTGTIEITGRDRRSEGAPGGVQAQQLAAPPVVGGQDLLDRPQPVEGGDELDDAPRSQLGTQDIPPR